MRQYRITDRRGGGTWLEWLLPSEVKDFKAKGVKVQAVPIGSRLGRKTERKPRQTK